MKTKLTFTLLLAVLTACGGSVGNTGNQNRSNASSSNANTSNAVASNTTSDSKAADPSPISKDSFDFYMMIKESSDPKEFVGRSVSITELDLKEIDSSTLHLGYSWFFFVECEGSFSEYMSVKDVVEKRAKDKPVQATIQGVIKEATKDTVKLEPCAMTDVKK